MPLIKHLHEEKAHWILMAVADNFGSGEWRPHVARRLNDMAERCASRLKGKPVSIESIMDVMERVSEEECRKNEDEGFYPGISLCIWAIENRELTFVSAGNISAMQFNGARQHRLFTPNFLLPSQRQRGATMIGCPVANIGGALPRSHLHANRLEILEPALVLCTLRWNEFPSDFHQLNGWAGVDPLQTYLGWCQAKWGEKPLGVVAISLP